MADAFGSRGTYDALLASRRGIGDVPHMVEHGLGTIAYLVSPPRPAWP
ncbi:MAG: hypothetical protein R2695_22080 [Acidimicrobiales bacterium]